MSAELVIKGIMEELSKSTKKGDFDKTELVRKVEKVWGLMWDVSKQKIKGDDAIKLTDAFIVGRPIFCLKILAQIRDKGEYSLDDVKSNLSRIYSALLRALKDGIKIFQNGKWPICVYWLEDKGTSFAIEELKSHGFIQKKDEQLEKSQTALAIEYYFGIISNINEKGGKLKKDQHAQILSSSYFEAFIPYVQSGFDLYFISFLKIISSSLSDQAPLGEIENLVWNLDLFIPSNHFSSICTCKLKY